MRPWKRLIDLVYGVFWIVYVTGKVKNALQLKNAVEGHPPLALSCAS
jgi:hypothetical protein